MVLEIFWMNIDPTDNNGQFVDKGFQYTSAIFTHDNSQKELAGKSKQILLEMKKFKKDFFPKAAHKYFQFSRLAIVKPETETSMVYLYARGLKSLNYRTIAYSRNEMIRLIEQKLE